MEILGVVVGVFITSALITTFFCLLLNVALDKEYDDEDDDYGGSSNLRYTDLSDADLSGADLRGDDDE